MNKNIYVIFRNDGFFGDDVKFEVIRIISYIPKQEFNNIRICIDESGQNSKGIRREWLKKFVRENLFDINKIYADSEVDIACDITEINIFIAVMYLFGIKVYYGNTYVIPDQVYVGEIQKIIKRKLKEHPMCIAKASPEERAVVIDIILDIFDNLLLDYRKKCNS